MINETHGTGLNGKNVFVCHNFEIIGHCGSYYFDTKSFQSKVCLKPNEKSDFRMSP